MSGILQAVMRDFRTYGVPPSQQAYTTAGTYSWVVPTGVTKVSIVAVGGGAGGQPGVVRTGGGAGGGLAYSNNVSVTPGESLTVTVGSGGASNTNGGNSKLARSGTSLVEAGGGLIITCSLRAGRAGRLIVGCGGGAGGPNDCTTNLVAASGAGGYSGNGGYRNSSGASVSATGGAGGSGGEGRVVCGGIAYRGGSGSGGVGILGSGSSGANGASATVTCNAVGGTGGSSGSSGGAGPSQSGIGGNGGTYGGGGGTGGYVCPCFGGISRAGGQGGGGAVRIIWPGNTRSFPSTCTGNL